MEELRSYYQIPDNIDFELPDSVDDESTFSKEYSAVYFYPGTARNGASLPRFISSQAVSTLLCSAAYSIHPNVIQILTGCSVFEPPLPTGYFVGRGLLYLYLEAGHHDDRLSL